MLLALAAWILSRADGPGLTGGEKDMRGWKPLLVKKGDMPVVLVTALLSANSAIGSQRTQLSCIYEQ